MADIVDDGLPAGALDRVLVDRVPVDRVLVDRDGKAATHLVLRSGMASEDLLVPLGLVEGTLDLRPRLRSGRGELYRRPSWYDGRVVETARREEPWGVRGGGERWCR